VDEETKAEELELLLERKAQDKEKTKHVEITQQSKTSVPTPGVTMATSTKVPKSFSRPVKVTDSMPLTTKHPEEPVAKQTESKPVTQGVTHGVTQATEKEVSIERTTKPIDVNEVTKPTTKSVTYLVTQKVAPVTQLSESELSKERLEEDILEGRVPQPTKSHVIEVTGRHQTEHVTTQKSIEDFAKQLKKVIGKKQIHSRRNHELVQDELEMEDLGLNKVEGLSYSL
jgi:hypothetical protein